MSAPIHAVLLQKGCMVFLQGLGMGGKSRRRGLNYGIWQKEEISDMLITNLRSHFGDWQGCGLELSKYPGTIGAKESTEGRGSKTMLHFLHLAMNK